jgi:predicted metal-binding protein
MKAGIIRCHQTEDMCPGTTDFKVSSSGTCAFEETGPVEIVGFVSCGGCPGKRAVSRAKMMVDRRAEVIVFARCMGKGNPIGFARPHFDTIKEAVQKAIGTRARTIDWTH